MRARATLEESPDLWIGVWHIEELALRSYFTATFHGNFSQKRRWASCIEDARPGFIVAVRGSTGLRHPRAARIDAPSPKVGYEPQSP